MDVEIQARPGPMDVGDRTALGSGQAVGLFQLLEDALHEDASHGAEHLRTYGRQHAELPGQRQDPLPNGYIGQDAIDKVGCLLGHAPR